MRDPEFQDNTDLQIAGNSAAVAGGNMGPRNLWNGLCRIMEFVLYALIILAVIKLFWPEVDRQVALQSELERLTLIQNEKEDRVARLRMEHNLLKSDKEYLETISRDRLNMQKDGEFIFRIERD